MKKISNLVLIFVGIVLGIICFYYFSLHRYLILEKLGLIHAPQYNSPIKN